MSRISDLLDAAQRATGLANFGSDSFREGLEVLVESADREAKLNALGRARFDGTVINLLSKRLEVEDCYLRYPEIDAQTIIAPLMILGLPRTGSTALHCLLGEDPHVRVMRNWEAANPCPPPETATQHSDPRIAQAEAAMKLRDTLTPRMKQMLPSTAVSPTEDQFIMGYEFKSQVFQAMFRVPRYFEWLHYHADMQSAFVTVKRVMKLLQWRCPPTNWRLKNPSYSAFITGLDDIFPDARYCMTHRDVAKVMPSVADLYCEIGKVNTDEIDKVWIGEITTEMVDIGIQRVMAFREKGNEHRFFDIHFTPFQKDPFPTVQKLYDFLGEEFTPQAHARMFAWRQDTPRDKHGRHEYDAADYGLATASLRERFRYYTDCFNVPMGKD
jgi:hypothetical protein